MLAVHCGDDIPYEEALRWQRLLVDARATDTIDDVLLTLTHDRVYTAGRHADVTAHLLGTHDIRVVDVDRGGDITYHGPGQLVAYPIIRLAHAKAVRAYVSALEAACVRTAADFGVTAQPDRDRTGVWVGDDKLAAIGIRVDGGVTSHGLAFNVAPDLADFAGIVPCGIAGAGVTSLAALGADATMHAVRRRLVHHLGDALERPVQQAAPADLGLSLTGATAPR